MKNLLWFFLMLLFLPGCVTDSRPPMEVAPDPVVSQVPEGWKADPDPQRYEGPVVDHENQYAPGTLPKNPIVFVGSSTFTKWAGLETLWPGHRILNRGTGGSQMSDILYYFDRLVLVNNPRQVFVYEGDNDIDVGKPTAQVQAQFEEFGRLMKAKLPGVPVVFLAVKPSLARWSKAPLYKKFNSWLQQWAASQGWTFIDTWTPTLGSEGRPDPRFYERDGLHLNLLGYDKWIPILEPWLTAP